MNTLQRKSALAGSVMILLLTSTVCAQDTRFGFGDFCVHLNGGEDVAHVGVWNTLEIHIENDALLIGMSPGIEISISSTFYWDMSYGSHPPVNEEGRAIDAWDLGTGLMITHDFDDVSPDHIDFAGAIFFTGGLPAGPSDLCYSLRFFIPSGENPDPSGICIQPYFYPPNHSWTFIDEVSGYPPDFCGEPVPSASDPVAGPICFAIAPNTPPEITNCPTSTLYGGYCDIISYQFEASDAEGDPYVFEIVSGPGAVDPDGFWSFSPTVYDLGMHVVEIRACDDFGCGPTCLFEFEITNDAPVFTGGCGEILYGRPGQLIHHQLTADDPDYCAPIVFTLEAAIPQPSGPATMTGMGEFDFQPEPADTGLFTFVVRVYDEVNEYDECSFEVIVADGVVINEVRTIEMDDPAGERHDAFVELYNKSSSSQDVDGWIIAGNAGTPLASLPAWTMPPKTHLRVTFGSGTDDPDFSDGEGRFYTQQDSIDVIDPAADEIGLYAATHTETGLIDFVCWSTSGSYTGGTPYSHAVSRLMWSAGDFVDMSQYAAFSHTGICPSGYDHDSSADWREFGLVFFPLDNGRAPNPVQLLPLNGGCMLTGESLHWASINGATDYYVEIDDDSLFGSPIWSAFAPDTFYTLSSLPEGYYYWRVKVRNAGVFVDEYDVWEFYLEPSGSKGDKQDKLLGVPQTIQHKDTRLLCITDDSHPPGLPDCRRPGCQESDTSQHGPWDAPHATTHAHVTQCNHCSQYCARAAIQMINFFFGNHDNLTQDHISYQAVQNIVHPNKPEGDLGHGRFLYIDPNEIGPVLSWALGGHAVTRHLLPPSWATITAEIDVDHPIMVLLNVGHWEVIDGYRTRAGRNQIHVVDPAPAQAGGGLRTGWQILRGARIGYYYTLGAGVPANPRAEIAEVLTLDNDNDSIMDFDEGLPDYPSNRPRRFHCKFNEADSDSDQVDDKKEIRNYTFHDEDHYHPNCRLDDDDLDFPDIDRDGLRAEHDCDSDNDGDFDGGEDINGDGCNPVPEAGATGFPGETCQFDTLKNCLDVNVDKNSYKLGEMVYLVDNHGSRETHTFHASCLYHCEKTDGYVDKADGDPISWNRVFATDTLGCKKAMEVIVMTCLTADTFCLYVDILSDHKHSEPDNLDPSCCWVCENVWKLGMHPGGHHDYHNPDSPWPQYGYGTVCMVHGELTEADVFSPWWCWSDDWPPPPRDYWLGVSVPADLYFGEYVWLDELPAVVDQIDECSGLEVAQFAPDEEVELDLNEQYGDEGTYWLGFEVSNWQIPDSLIETSVQLTISPEMPRLGGFPLEIRMGDSDNGWAPASFDSIWIAAWYVCGDADGSGSVDIDDVVHMINYIFSGGPEPVPYESGDADCSSGLDIDDVVWLIAYIFSGGNAPCDTDVDGMPDC